MAAIDDYNFLGKKALIRVDFNVPLNDRFEITDDTRIKAALPTIGKVLNDGGAVILMSHLGRPKQGPEKDKSLNHLTAHLSELLGLPVKFSPDCIGATARENAANLNMGEVLLLENLRYYKHETAGDRGFAQELASLGDVYVNDAFGTAHRAHASTAIIAEFFTDKLFGYLIEQEIASVNTIFMQGQKPVTAIVGGAKVSSKISILENLLTNVNNVLIGGGMAYTFIKAQGGETGLSMVEDDMLNVATGILKKATELGVNILLPVDSVEADAFSADARTNICASNAISAGWMGLDIGPEATAAYCDVIRKSRTILWNGPVGVFEMTPFEAGTKAVAQAVADATTQGAFSLVGGGDSVAAVNKYHMADQVSHVSTGGGAMLEFLEGKELPGIKAITG